VKRRVLKKRYGRAGSGEFDRLLNGNGPYYYDNDTDLKILQDVARPRNSRKLPPPSHNVVYDRHYEALAKAGFLRWQYETPGVQHLGLDRYELTPKGVRALKVYRDWVQRVIVGPAKGGRR